MVLEEVKRVGVVFKNEVRKMLSKMGTCEQSFLGEPGGEAPYKLLAQLASWQALRGWKHYFTPHRARHGGGFSCHG